MLEWIFSGIAHTVVWLWTSATTLYYLGGFFIVVGGGLLFVASVVHDYAHKHVHPEPVDPVNEGPTAAFNIQILVLQIREVEAQDPLVEDLAALPTHGGTRRGKQVP